MKKICCYIFCCLIINGLNVVQAEITPSFSMSNHPYLPPTTPQPMYGLSGQQFVPQINITGGSTGIKLDNPYYENNNNNLKEQTNDIIQEPQSVPVNNPYAQNDLSPIYIK